MVFRYVFSTSVHTPPVLCIFNTSHDAKIKETSEAETGAATEIQDFEMRWNQIFPQYIGLNTSSVSIGPAE